MADPQIAGEILEGVLFKNFAHQPHAFVEGDISSGPCGIAYRDTTGFLAPVLEGQKAVIDGGRGIFPRKVIDPEDPAGFFELVLWIQFHESGLLYTEKRSAS